MHGKELQPAPRLLPAEVKAFSQLQPVFGAVSESCLCPFQLAPL